MRRSIGFRSCNGLRISYFLGASENPVPPMKHLEKITLMTVTTVYAGYLIQQAARTRTERLFRLAAGESPYERTHPKPRGTKKS